MFGDFFGRFIFANTTGHPVRYSSRNQVCQIVYFYTKTPNSILFGKAFER
jgi:hypothetical protein